MRGKRRFNLALLAALAAMSATALAASSAVATEVLPTNDKITAVNKTPTEFIPNNAYSTVGLNCYDSEAGFVVDNTRDRNINRPKTGTFSDDSGSVITDMNDNDQDPSARAPVFDDCWVSVWDPMNPQDPPTDIDDDVTVTTSDVNGWWTIAADAVKEREENDVVAIGVPMEGATVDIGLLGCTITVSPNQASSVMADFTDGDKQTAANLQVDGQIDFDGCDLDSPAQFEGDFAVTSASGAAVVINY